VKSVKKWNRTQKSGSSRKSDWIRKTEMKRERTGFTVWNRTKERESKISKKQKAK
jgi:hypothetical protein